MTSSTRVTDLKRLPNCDDAPSPLDDAVAMQQPYLLARSVDGNMALMIASMSSPVSLLTTYNILRGIVHNYSISTNPPSPLRRPYPKPRHQKSNNPKKEPYHNHERSTSRSGSPDHSPKCHQTRCRRHWPQAVSCSQGPAASHSWSCGRCKCIKALERTSALIPLTRLI